MKDKNTIINEIMANAADIMEAKLDYIELVAKQFEDKGNAEQAARCRKDIPRIKAAVELMREYGGCWA